MTTDETSPKGRLREGLWRGVSFGLCFAAAEALMYVPAAVRMHLQAPLHAILKSLAFDLVAGALLGLALSPLLRARRRGGLWHTLACVVVLGAVVFWLSPRFLTALLLTGGVLLMTLALHAAGLWLRRKPALAWTRLPGAAILLLAAFGVPRALTPRPPAPPPAEAAPPAGAPNILFIVMDTVRADHIGAYGYGRNTAPTLGRLAAQGAFFERAIAAGTWTIPSHASMFTGLFPSAHGANHEGNRLPLENITLAEVLHAHGYRTMGFNSNPFMTDSNGFTQGFDRMEPSWLMMTAPLQFLSYRLAIRLGLLFSDHGARQVTTRFTRWLDKDWDGKQPFFVFLNYIESHFPYQVLPPASRDRFVRKGTTVAAMREASDAAMGGQLFGDQVDEDQIKLVRDLYDGGILYEDGLIAKVLEAVKARGILDNTVIILVSDHGELFGEHGLYGHEMSLSERLLHVPLVIRYPKRVPAGLRVSAPVTTVSLFETVLDLAGVPGPEHVQARSLVPIFDAGKTAEDIAMGVGAGAPGAGGVVVRMAGPSGPKGEVGAGAGAQAGTEAGTSAEAGARGAAGTAPSGVRIMTTPPEARSPIFSEQHKFHGLIQGTYKPQGPFDQMGVRYRAFEEGGWKLVVDSKGDRWLFHPVDDPNELKDYAAKYPAVLQRLMRAEQQIVKGFGLGAIDAPKLGPGGNVALDPAAKEGLKALGYVQ